MTDVQVMPVTSSDETTHVLDGTCWCQPVVDYEDPVSGARVYVHRRTLDGPAYESADAARVAFVRSWQNPDADDGSEVHEEDQP